MKIKTIILLCLITQVLLTSGLVELKNALTTSDSPLLMKILQSVDAATSDEHLLDVTLKLLKSLCICMRATLKEKEESFNADNTSLTAGNSSNIDRKVLDLYKKIYNNTCFNLRQQLKIRSQKSVAEEERAFLNHTNCGKHHKNLTHGISSASDVSQKEKSPFSSRLEHILYKTLVETKELHRYRIKRYNLFGKGEPHKDSLLKHSIIVILTLHPDVREKSIRTHKTLQEEFNKTLYSNSPIDIDIIDTKHDRKDKDNEEHPELENFSDCNLKSLYKFLVASETNNLTKVFKFIRKLDAIKIYVEVNTVQNNTDYINICCGNQSQCDDQAYKINRDTDKRKPFYHNYKNTILKIKDLVKLYKNKINHTNEINTSVVTLIPLQNITKRGTIVSLDRKSTTNSDDLGHTENNIHKLVTNPSEPLKLGEVTQAILLLNDFVSKHTSNKYQDGGTDKLWINRISKEDVLQDNEVTPTYLPIDLFSEKWYTEHYNTDNNMFTTATGLKNDKYINMNSVESSKTPYTTLPLSPVTHRTSKLEKDWTSTLKVNKNFLVNHPFTMAFTTTDINNGLGTDHFTAMNIDKNMVSGNYTDYEKNALIYGKESEKPKTTINTIYINNTDYMTSVTKSLREDLTFQKYNAFDKVNGVGEIKDFVESDFDDLLKQVDTYLDNFKSVSLNPEIKVSTHDENSAINPEDLIFTKPSESPSFYNNYNLSPLNNKTVDSNIKVMNKIMTEKSITASPFSVESYEQENHTSSKRNTDKIKDFIKYTKVADLTQKTNYKPVYSQVITNEVAEMSRLMTTLSNSTGDIREVQTYDHATSNDLEYFTNQPQRNNKYSSPVTDKIITFSGETSASNPLSYASTDKTLEPGLNIDSNSLNYITNKIFDNEITHELPQPKAIMTVNSDTKMDDKDKKEKSKLRNTVSIMQTKVPATNVSFINKIITITPFTKTSSINHGPTYDESTKTTKIAGKDTTFVYIPSVKDIDPFQDLKINCTEIYQNKTITDSVTKLSKIFLKYGNPTKDVNAHLNTEVKSKNFTMTIPKLNTHPEKSRAYLVPGFISVNANMYDRFLTNKPTLPKEKTESKFINKVNWETNYFNRTTADEIPETIFGKISSKTKDKKTSDSLFVKTYTTKSSNTKDNYSFYDTISSVETYTETISLNRNHTSGIIGATDVSKKSNISKKLNVSLVSQVSTHSYSDKISVVALTAPSNEKRSFTNEPMHTVNNYKRENDDITTKKAKDTSSKHRTLLNYNIDGAGMFTQKITESAPILTKLPKNYLKKLRIFNFKSPNTKTNLKAAKYSASSDIFKISNSNYFLEKSSYGHFSKMGNYSNLQSNTNHLNEITLPGMIHVTLDKSPVILVETDKNQQDLINTKKYFSLAMTKKEGDISQETTVPNLNEKVILKQLSSRDIIKKPNRITELDAVDSYNNVKMVSIIPVMKETEHKSQDISPADFMNSHQVYPPTIGITSEFYNKPENTTTNFLLPHNLNVLTTATRHDFKITPKVIKYLNNSNEMKIIGSIGSRLKTTNNVLATNVNQNLDASVAKFSNIFNNAKTTQNPLTLPVFTTSNNDLRKVTTVELLKVVNKALTNISTIEDTTVSMESSLKLVTLENANSGQIENMNALMPDITHRKQKSNKDLQITSLTNPKENVQNNESGDDQLLIVTKYLRNELTKDENAPKSTSEFPLSKNFTVPKKQNYYIKTNMNKQVINQNNAKSRHLNKSAINFGHSSKSSQDILIKDNTVQSLSTYEPFLSDNAKQLTFKHEGKSTTDRLTLTDKYQGNSWNKYSNLTVIDSNITDKFLKTDNKNSPLIETFTEKLHNIKADLVIRDLMQDSKKVKHSLKSLSKSKLAVIKQSNPSKVTATTDNPVDFLLNIRLGIKAAKHELRVLVSGEEINPNKLNNLKSQELTLSNVIANIEATPNFRTTVRTGAQENITNNNITIKDIPKNYLNNEKKSMNTDSIDRDLRNLIIRNANLTRKSNTMYKISKDLVKIVSNVHGHIGNSTNKTITRTTTKTTTRPINLTTIHQQQKEYLNNRTSGRIQQYHEFMTNTESGVKNIGYNNLTKYIKHKSMLPGVLTQKLGIDNLKSIYKTHLKNKLKHMKNKNMSTTEILKQIFNEENRLTLIENKKVLQSIKSNLLNHTSVSNITFNKNKNPSILKYGITDKYLNKKAKKTSRQNNLKLADYLTKILKSNKLNKKQLQMLSKTLQLGNISKPVPQKNGDKINLNFSIAIPTLPTTLVSTKIYVNKSLRIHNLETTTTSSSVNATTFRKDKRKHISAQKLKIQIDKPTTVDELFDRPYRNNNSHIARRYFREFSEFTTNALSYSASMVPNITLNKYLKEDSTPAESNSNKRNTIYKTTTEKTLETNPSKLFKTNTNKKINNTLVQSVKNITGFIKEKETKNQIWNTEKEQEITTQGRLNLETIFNTSGKYMFKDDSFDKSLSNINDPVTSNYNVSVINYINLYNNTVVIDNVTDIHNNITDRLIINNNSSLLPTNADITIKSNKIKPSNETLEETINVSAGYKRRFNAFYPTIERIDELDIPLTQNSDNTTSAYKYIKAKLISTKAVENSLNLATVTTSPSGVRNTKNNKERKTSFIFTHLSTISDRLKKETLTTSDMNDKASMVLQNATSGNNSVLPFTSTTMATTKVPSQVYNTDEHFINTKTIELPSTASVDKKIQNSLNSRFFDERTKMEENQTRKEAYFSRNNKISINDNYVINATTKLPSASISNKILTSLLAVQNCSQKTVGDCSTSMLIYKKNMSKAVKAPKKAYDNVSLLINDDVDENVTIRIITTEETSTYINKADKEIILAPQYSTYKTNILKKEENLKKTMDREEYITSEISRKTAYIDQNKDMTFPEISKDLSVLTPSIQNISMTTEKLDGTNAIRVVKDESKEENENIRRIITNQPNLSSIAATMLSTKDNINRNKYVKNPNIMNALNASTPPGYGLNITFDYSVGNNSAITVVTKENVFKKENNSIQIVQHLSQTITTELPSTRSYRYRNETITFPKILKDLSASTHVIQNAGIIPRHADGHITNKDVKTKNKLKKEDNSQKTILNLYDTLTSELPSTSAHTDLHEVMTFEILSAPTPAIPSLVSHTGDLVGNNSTKKAANKKYFDIKEKKMKKTALNLFETITTKRPSTSALTDRIEAKAILSFTKKNTYRDTHRYRRTKMNNYNNTAAHKFKNVESEINLTERQNDVHIMNFKTAQPITNSYRNQNEKISELLKDVDTSIPKIQHLKNITYVANSDSIHHLDSKKINTKSYEIQDEVKHDDQSKKDDLNKNKIQVNVLEHKITFNNNTFINKTKKLFNSSTTNGRDVLLSSQQLNVFRTPLPLVQSLTKTYHTQSYDEFRDNLMVTEIYKNLQEHRNIVGDKYIVKPPEEGLTTEAPPLTFTSSITFAYNKMYSTELENIKDVTNKNPNRNTSILAHSKEEKLLSLKEDVALIKGKVNKLNNDDAVLNKTITNRNKYNFNTTTDQQHKLITSFTKTEELTSLIPPVAIVLNKPAEVTSGMIITVQSNHSANIIGHKTSRRKIKQKEKFHKVQSEMNYPELFKKDKGTINYQHTITTAQEAIANSFITETVTESESLSAQTNHFLNTFIPTKLGLTDIRYIPNDNDFTTPLYEVKLNGTRDGTNYILDEEKPRYNKTEIWNYVSTEPSFVLADNNYKQTNKQTSQTNTLEYLETYSLTKTTFLPITQGLHDIGYIPDDRYSTISLFKSKLNSSQAASQNTTDDENPEGNITEIQNYGRKKLSLSRTNKLTPETNILEDLKTNFVIKTTTGDLIKLKNADQLAINETLSKHNLKQETLQTVSLLTTSKNVDIQNATYEKQLNKTSMKITELPYLPPNAYSANTIIATSSANLLEKFIKPDKTHFNAKNVLPAKQTDFVSTYETLVKQKPMNLPSKSNAVSKTAGYSKVDILDSNIRPSEINQGFENKYSNFVSNTTTTINLNNTNSFMEKLKYRTGGILQPLTKINTPSLNINNILYQDGKTDKSVRNIPGVDSKQSLNYKYGNNSEQIMFLANANDKIKNMSPIHALNKIQVKDTNILPFNKLNADTKFSDMKNNIISGKKTHSEIFKEKSQENGFEKNYENITHSKEKKVKVDNLQIFSSRLNRLHAPLTPMTIVTQKNIKYNTYKPTTKEDLELLMYDNQPIVNTLMYKKNHNNPHSNTTINSSCATLKSQINMFHTISEYTAALKSANCTESDEMKYAQYQGGINRNIYQPAENYNSAAPSILKNNISFSPKLNIYDNIHPIVDINRNSPSMMQINRNFPLHIGVNNNSPLLMDTNRNLSPSMDNNRKLASMVEIDGNLPSVFDMNKNLPPLLQINKNSPLLIDTNRNSASMIEINKYSPSFLDIITNSPSLIEVTRYPPPLLDINGNFGNLQTGRNIQNVGRLLPMMSSNINQSPSRIKNNRMSPFSISQNSPLMENVNINSQSFIRTDMNSFPFMDSSGNLPAIINSARDSLPIVESNVDSLPTPSNLGKSPSVIEINNFPQMKNVYAHPYLMIKNDLNTIPVINITGNVTEILPINEQLPPMTKIFRNSLSKGEDNRKLSVFENNIESPSIDIRRLSNIGFDVNPPAITTNYEKSFSSIEINRRNSLRMQDANVKNYPIPTIERGINSLSNKNYLATFEANKNLFPREFNLFLPMVSSDHRNSPPQIDVTKNKQPIIEQSLQSFPAMDRNMNSHPIIEINRNSPPVMEINRNSLTKIAININSPSMIEANKNSTATNELPLMEFNINSLPMITNYKKLPTEEKHKFSPQNDNIYVIRNRSVQTNKKPAPMMKNNVKSRPRSDVNRGSFPVIGVKRNLLPILENNRKKSGLIDIHKNPHPIEINGNLHPNIVMNNNKRISLAVEKHLINPFEKRTQSLKMSPAQMPKKPSRRMKLGNQRKEVMTMNTQDFFSQHRFVTAQNGLNRFAKSNSAFYRPVTSVPRQSILKPKFDLLDKPSNINYITKPKFEPINKPAHIIHNIRPKPLIIRHQDHHKDDKFGDKVIIHHIPDTTNLQRKSNSVHSTFQKIGVMAKKPRTNHIWQEPIWQPTANSKYLKDRLPKRSFKSSIYNSDIVTATRESLLSNEVLRKPKGFGDSEDYYRTPGLTFRRNDQNQPSTTVAPRTPRRGRTIFFLSPTIPDSLYI